MGNHVNALDVPVHRSMAEDFQKMSSEATADARKDARQRAFAITLGAVLTGIILLNGGTPLNIA